MTPLERAKLRIEEDAARRRREQQDRLKSRSSATQDSHAPAHDPMHQLSQMHVMAELPPASRHDCESTAYDSNSAWSSSSSDSCSSSSSSSFD